jgi:DNA-directed RNA polymerase specialized sigma24 family protein
VIYHPLFAHIDKYIVMAVQNTFGSTPAEREKHFMYLYKKAFPAVAKYVSKKGGSFDEAKDVFQDALVIFYEKAVTGTIVLHVNEQAYLMGIAKNLWTRRFNSSVNNLSLGAENVHFDFAEAEDAQPSSNKLMSYLETAGQKCMEMLKAFYYDNLPVVKIAELFGYSGERSATVQKYKCMEKVRETIKEKSLAYEDFIE